ncbi:hypothetical protein [Virgibacillus salexigens]|uniref:Uncharacterized protein n=1 Tax=Virgibacillus kapii TaxID=1638645 RepID=A0ABQ2DGZ9_9BACI|nr:hypothetical protein [Virgibacillus kapii]GGJ57351.1 hypothetical protein GCM10007111_19410 [Virgibacillus kapii]
MKTCAYCATELKTDYCPFCEMELSECYILKDGERLKNDIPYFPEQRDIFKSTKELLDLETLELLCLLRHARNYRTEVYKLRILTHRATEQGGDMTEIEASSYSDYEEATRKMWVIENIIKDRMGYYPKKVTEKFLSLYLQRIEESQTKEMFMKKAAKSNC